MKNAKQMSAILCQQKKENIETKFFSKHFNEELQAFYTLVKLLQNLNIAFIQQ